MTRVEIYLEKNTLQQAEILAKQSGINLSQYIEEVLKSAAQGDKKAKSKQVKPQFQPPKIRKKKLQISRKNEDYD